VQVVGELDVCGFGARVCGRGVVGCFGEVDVGEIGWREVVCEGGYADDAVGIGGGCGCE
jgi:hypothetical protein